MYESLASCLLACVPVAYWLLLVLIKYLLMPQSTGDTLPLLVIEL